MKLGKVSQNILKRSILKNITPRSKKVLMGAGVGNDYSAISLDNGGVIVISANPVIIDLNIDLRKAAYYAINRTVNDIAVSGGKADGILTDIIIPAAYSEVKIKEIIKGLDEVAGLLNIEILGGHTTSFQDIKRPIITVTGVGECNKLQCSDATKLSDKRKAYKFIISAKFNQDLVVTKYIGLEGTSYIARKLEEKLLTRFTGDFVDKAKDFINYLSVVPEAAVAGRHGVTAMHNVSEGGIFGALWEMADGANIGFEVDLKKIPILQETVEICEFLGLNPYQLQSNGALLIAADNGYNLVRELDKNGIHAVVIGRTSKGIQRKLINDDEIRFLDLPKPDEIYSISASNLLGASLF